MKMGLSQTMNVRPVQILDLELTQIKTLRQELQEAFVNGAFRECPICHKYIPIVHFGLRDNRWSIGKCVEKCGISKTAALFHSICLDCRKKHKKTFSPLSYSVTIRYSHLHTKQQEYIMRYA